MARRFRSQAFVLRQFDLNSVDQTRVRELSSPRPNPSFSFSLRYSAGAYRRKSQHFKTSLPVAAVWLSVYSKIHESCKSEVKPQIKVVIVQQSAALRARFTIFTLRASQFRAGPFLNRCIFAVYTTNETVSFWKRSTFESVFKTTRFRDKELDRRRVNERRNRIKTDAVTNETASV